MKLESKLLSINIEDRIHWFPPLSAIGKSYMSTFVKGNGIDDVIVYTVSNKEEFDNIDGLVPLLKDKGILILDRTDLYLTNEDLRKLAKYEYKRILIDRKVVLPLYAKTVYIAYDGVRMELTDEDCDGRFKNAIMQYYDG